MIDICQITNCHAVPSRAKSARWILCACSLRWRRAIQTAIRCRAPAGPHLAEFVETPHAAQCLALLELYPASIVTLTAEADNFPSCLDLTRTIDRRFADAGVVILRSDEEDVWEARIEQEAALREAGAVAVVRSIWSVDGLLDRVYRHVGRSLPCRLPIAARIWAELPWETVGD